MKSISTLFINVLLLVMYVKFMFVTYSQFAHIFIKGLPSVVSVEFKSSLNV